MKDSTVYAVYDANDYLITDGKATEWGATQAALEWAKNDENIPAFPFRMFAIDKRYLSSFNQSGTTSILLNYVHRHVDLPKGKWRLVLKGHAKKGDKVWNITTNKWENASGIVLRLKHDFQAPHDFYALIRRIKK